MSHIIPNERKTVPWFIKNFTIYFRLLGEFKITVPTTEIFAKYFWLGSDR